MASPRASNETNGTANSNGLIVGDQKYSSYKIVEPTSHASPLAPNGFSSRTSGFGSKSSAHAFGSIRSVTSNASQRLANAKPTLQSSWLNVSTAPIPLGASCQALHEDGAEKFKSQEEIDKEASAPPDRFKMVYIILLIHGIGMLLPWNMFLTANSYFTEFKLAPKANETESEYAKNFLSYLGITAQLTSMILTGVNIFCHCGRGRSNVRLPIAVCSLIVMFLITVALAMVDSQDWPGTFFGLTMASIVIINMCSGVYQSSLFGIAGVFPMKYTNAVIVGSNVSGTVTSVIMIISLLAAPSLQLAAIWYFVAAIMALCVALVTYFLLPLLSFYRHFAKPTSSESDEDSQKALVEQDQISDMKKDGVIERPPYSQIFKKIWVQLLGVWLTFFVSLICFPAIQADIRPSNPALFPDNLYTPITTFLFFNFFATLGNITTEWVRKPGPRFVIIPILLRLLYVPFFMFCNFRPEIRTLPVYISNDFAYFAGGVTMAFSSGYFSSLCMMYSPSLVESQWAGTAAMISAFFLVFGIVSGVNFSLVVAKIIEL